MPEEIIRRKRRLSSFQIIILGFAGVILLGALLLMLPISTTGGNVTPFNETLFTATSAVCVTGLVVQDTGSYWSTFGQAVILALIQIGGLGVVTVAASFALLSGRRISLMQRSTMQDAISAPKVGGIVRLTRFILRGTFLIELLGALAMLPVFCRDYGWRGIWMAVFHSISAFCNAGFDILGTESNRYLPIPYRLCWQSGNQCYDYAADRGWRHWLSDMGRYLRKQVAVSSLPNAEQGDSRHDRSFDFSACCVFLLFRLFCALRRKPAAGILFSVRHAEDSGLQHGKSIRDVRCVAGRDDPFDAHRRFSGFYSRRHENNDAGGLDCQCHCDLPPAR